jgi:hypothetical protein
LEGSLHPAPETLYEFGYDTRADGILKVQIAGSGRFAVNSELIVGLRG